MDRVIYDEIQMMQIDPGYGDSFACSEQRALSETGQAAASRPRVFPLLLARNLWLVNR